MRGNSVSCTVDLVVAKIWASLPRFLNLGEVGWTSAGVKAKASANSLIEGLSLTVSSGSDLVEGFNPSLLSASATIFFEPWM